MFFFQALIEQPQVQDLQAKAETVVEIPGEYTFGHTCKVVLKVSTGVRKMRHVAPPA